MGVNFSAFACVVYAVARTLANPPQHRRVLGCARRGDDFIRLRLILRNTGVFLHWAANFIAEVAVRRFPCLTRGALRLTYRCAPRFDAATDTTANNRAGEKAN